MAPLSTTLLYTIAVAVPLVRPGVAAVIKPPNVPVIVLFKNTGSPTTSYSAAVFKSVFAIPTATGTKSESLTVLPAILIFSVTTGPD